MSLGAGMLQIDFTKNYTTQWQDEMQSAHWCKNQVTLMTVVYWHDKECTSVVVVSDDNDHTKNSTVVFLQHLIKSLVSSDVARLHIWSDDPSGQFKNHHTAAVMRELESTFCTKIT